MVECRWDKSTLGGEERLRESLQSLVGLPLELTLTDNSSTMISYTIEDHHLRLRLHHMFIDAAPGVIIDLVRYILEEDPAASRRLDRFIRSNNRKINRRVGVKRRLVTAGRHHDLQAIFDELNQTYFDGAILARITWTNAPRLRFRVRRTIKMGSYSKEERLIRIHPALDQEYVPRYFLEWIVFHEMLHERHGAISHAGRRRIHTQAFLEEERRFKGFTVAQQWERENIDRLLSY